MLDLQQAESNTLSPLPQRLMLRTDRSLLDPLPHGSQGALKHTTDYSGRHGSSKHFLSFSSSDREKEKGREKSSDTDLADARSESGGRRKESCRQSIPHPDAG